MEIAPNNGDKKAWLDVAKSWSPLGDVRALNGEQLHALEQALHEHRNHVAHAGERVSVSNHANIISGALAPSSCANWNFNSDYSWLCP